MLGVCGCGLVVGGNARALSALMDTQAWVTQRNQPIVRCCLFSDYTAHVVICVVTGGLMDFVARTRASRLVISGGTCA